MKRVAIGERPDWRETARANGFVFHTIDGAPYWDESHAYAFTLEEIERGIEAPATELHALCLEIVDRVVSDEAALAALEIPQTAWNAVRGSWRRRDPSLYGRLDFAYGGADGPAKLLEYNADTPTALYETAVFQWIWFEQMLAAGRLPAGSDQFNAVHERLIARFSELPLGGLLAFSAYAEAPEDRGTVAYLQDCALQAGRTAPFVDLPALGLREDGHFCLPDETPIDTLFKLYPWEWAFADSFASALDWTPTRFLEPPWKAVLSNKGLLPLLWAAEPGHPNLLPAYFESDPRKAELGKSFARKPLHSREGANVLLVRDGAVLARGEGPYGESGYVRQGLAELPAFDGRHALVGAWIVGEEAAGLCVREGAGPITTDSALFVPHYIAPG